MYITLFLLFVSPCFLISCEWVQISQSARSSHEIPLNTSLMMKNTGIHIYDYSKYKDFFSYINPKLDIVKVDKNSIDSYYKNQSNRNDVSTSIEIFTEVYPSRIEKDNRISDTIALLNETRNIVLKPLPFEEIIRFFINIENWFSMNNLEGIQYKTTILKKFQNSLLIDIGLLKS